MPPPRSLLSGINLPGNVNGRRTMQRLRTHTHCFSVYSSLRIRYSNSSKSTKPGRLRGGACCFNKAILASLSGSFGGLGNMVLRVDGILNSRSIGLQPGMTESRLLAGTTSMRRHRKSTSSFISFGISSTISCCLAAMPLKSPILSASSSSTIAMALS